MNNQDRKKLEKAQLLIDEAYELIEGVKDGEQEKFDNLSEGLQAAESGVKLEDGVGYLDEVISNLDEAKSTLDKLQNLYYDLNDTGKELNL